jgi:release factor glutamine methyltransferase
MRISNNSLQAANSFFHSELAEILNREAANYYFYALAEHFLQKKKLHLLMDENIRLSESEMLMFTQAIKRIKKHEPLQYIIGNTEFFGLNIKVSPSVLIPRPETEQLVELCLQNNLQAKLRVIDLCTGSGCIALALKKHRPDWDVFALDKYENALKQAKENSDLLGLPINFIKADVLFDFEQKLDGKFDIIISNPPYVRQSEAAQMKSNVLDHEPHEALFVADDDALVFYRKMIDFARQNLQKGGFLFFEINEYKGKEMLDLFTGSAFINVTLLKDAEQKDRFVMAEKG